MFAERGPARSVSMGRAAEHNLVVIFPQICWWEEWSSAPSALAHWLCWHAAQAERAPHSFSQAEGSVIHHSQNPTSHSSQTFTPRAPTPPSSSRWRTPQKEDCSDMRKALFHRLPSLFPTFPQQCSGFSKREVCRHVQLDLSAVMEH